MIQDADAVIVGGGAFGTSIAYHLAKFGLGRIVLLDKFEISSQTSARAAGIVGQLRDTDLMTRLAMMSVSKLTQFTEETGEPLDFYQSGSMRIARTLEHEQRLRRQVERGRRLGLDVDFISRGEASRLCPLLETAGIRAIAYTPTDLYLEPSQLPFGYARATERRGAVLMPYTTVTSIIVHHGAVERVVTDKGDVRTPIVVNAAGAWAGLIGQMAGLRIPIVPTRHQLFITEPLSGVSADQPIVRIIDANNTYIRPDKGGLMLGGYEADPLQYDLHRLPRAFQIKDLDLDISVLRRLADGVLDHFPVFRGARIREHRGGLPTMTPDGNPIVGPVPAVKGLFLVSGCCVGGLSISPALGEALAASITSQPTMDLAPLALTRFGPEYSLEERLNDSCRWQYSHKSRVS